tara:strand:+ start:101 stop:1972 length:1872 start_codon:yes stop_codon:yes gene_type:complete
MGIADDFGDFAEAMDAAAGRGVAEAGGGVYGSGQPGWGYGTPQSIADQQAASAAAAQAAQDAQVQDIIDQLSSMGWDLSGRRSAAAAAGYDPTEQYGGKGYQEGSWSTAASELENLFEDMSVGAGYEKSGIPTPAGRTNNPTMPYNELYDVFGIRNQTSLPNYDKSVFNANKPREDERGIFTNEAMEKQAAADAAIKEVNRTPPSQLSGDAAQLAAFREMGYNPKMASGWEAARNTAGDLVAGILQGFVPFGGVAELVAPDTTKGIRGGIAEGINDLFGTHAPERNPWNASGTGVNPNMDRDTFVGLAADIPPTTSGFRGAPDPWGETDDGNIQAIRRFLQDPVYGNIPQIDPASAMAAYQNAIRGIDAVVGERGFTGQGYAQAARDRSKTIFDELLPGQDVDTMLNEKIGRAFAEEALTAKEGEFRQQGIESINQAFPEGFSSEIFDPKAFSQAAENIYGQKLGGAQDIIARAGARGQLSPRGGRLASESLLSQGPDVRSGISDIVSGVRSGLESGLEGIRGSALEQAQGYKLGDELFDVQPFTQQASDYLSERAPAIGTEISEAIGTDPLFDAVSALQEGGRQQGVVSGTPSFLDVLAERESTPGTGRDRRGLGSRGSGVF